MNKDRQIQQDVKKAFDRHQLDADTGNALRRARERALDQEPAAWNRAWLPSAALASLVLVVVAFVASRTHDSNELPQMSADEIAVITSEDELELFEELEFYIWLEGDEKT